MKICKLLKSSFQNLLCSRQEPRRQRVQLGLSQLSSQGEECSPACVREFRERGDTRRWFSFSYLRTGSSCPVPSHSTCLSRGSKKKRSPARKGSHSTSPLVPVTRKCSSPNLGEFQCSGVMVMPSFSFPSPLSCCVVPQVLDQPRLSDYFTHPVEISTLLLVFVLW